MRLPQLSIVVLLLACVATAVADVIPCAGTNPRTRTPTPVFQTATNVDYNWPVRGVCSGRDRTQQIVGPEPRGATFASSVIRRSCSVTPWPGQLRRSIAS